MIRIAGLRVVLPCRMARFAIALLLLAAQSDKPSLVIRVSLPVSLASSATGCSPILLVAEIKGPETEPWYCPRVDWEWPNGTVSTTESDCPPFEARDACLEPQVGCGVTGWHRDSSGAIVEDGRPCPCTIVGYPRRWTRQVCLPPHSKGDAWEITVRLSRDGRVFAAATGRAIVR